MMYVCDKHGTDTLFVYDESNCPMCMEIDEYLDKIKDLLEEIIDLKCYISDLEKGNV